MFETRKAAYKRRLQLSYQLTENRQALYTALTHHTERCICRLTAEALLEQALWPVDDFIRAFEAGELGE